MTQLITDDEVDQLAQVLRAAYVTTMIGRHSGFTMVPWSDLTGREKAPYLAQAVAAFRHFKVLPTDRQMVARV